MDLTTKDQQDCWNALERLLRIARKDTGQTRRVASFLLAWHNTEENGGWDLLRFFIQWPKSPSWALSCGQLRGSEVLARLCFEPA